MLQSYNKTRQTIGWIWFSLFTITFNLPAVASEQTSLTIGFGSCSDQKREQPIWDKIAAHNPELFILMGDNVYIDSADPQKMKVAYQAFSNKPEFKKFRKQVPLVATWDDHDYGARDGGKEFDGKQNAKKAFLKFFDYPELAPVKSRNGGIYHTKWIDFNDKKIQIILLDTRWYRDQLVDSYLTESQRETVNLGPYQPSFEQGITILGQKQWKWLENELKKPADLKLLVSSIQVLTEYSGWEIWANFPAERKKLLDMLQQHTDDNLLILSGDIHRAEIVEVKHQNSRLLEITSSGLAVKTYPAAVNKHRVGNAFTKKNYGMIKIKNGPKLSASITIFDENGQAQLTTNMAAQQ